MGSYQHISIHRVDDSLTKSILKNPIPHDRVIVCNATTCNSTSIPLFTHSQTNMYNVSPPLIQPGVMDYRGMITTMSSREVNNIPTYVQTEITDEHASREIPLASGLGNIVQIDPQTLPRENAIGNIITRRNSQDSDHTSTRSESAFEISKEFNRILKKTHPPTFSGEPRKYYPAWKNLLKSEVESLALSPNQWYELLTHRTTGEALTIVTDFGSDVGERPMKNIIDSLWKALDRLFLPSSKPSQELLDELLVGPPISRNDFDRLKNFSLKCERFVSFTSDNPDLSLIYDHDLNLNGLCRRLEETLLREWLHEKREIEDSQGKVSLRDFNKWICGIFEQEQSLEYLNAPRPTNKYSSNCGANDNITSHLPPPSFTYYRSNEHQGRVSFGNSNNQASESFNANSYRSNMCISTNQNHLPAGHDNHPPVNQPISVGHVSVNRVTTDRKSRRAHMYKIEKVSHKRRHECSWCRTANMPYRHDPIHCKIINQYGTYFKEFADHMSLCYVCLQHGHNEYDCNRKRNRCTLCQLPHTELLPHTEALSL